MTAKLVDAGMDYLRITSDDQGAKKRLLGYYQRKALLDEKLGFKQTIGGAFGFVGSKCRHALHGVKGDWAMVQVSGRYAKDGLAIAYPATQATRIDIQLTFQYEQGEACERIREAYDAACAHVRPKARPLSVRMIEERHQPQTVYVGSRASDIFIRVYDKFEESGREEYRNCVRYELELKGRAAKALWKKMCNESLGIGYMLLLAVKVLEERGVFVPDVPLPPQGVAIELREKTSEENTLAWMARQVAPVVSRMSSTHGWILLFSVLFDKAVSDWDRHAIMSTLAKVWGS